MLPGIQSRIEFELKRLIKEKLKIKHRFRDSSYVGAKIFSSDYKDYDDYWISKKDWDECGTKIIDEKAKSLLR